MKKVYLSLGSNIGDTKRNLEKALELLSEEMEIRKVSSYYETEPVGYADQDWFLNIVVEALTDMEPYDLLKVTQGIENAMKRVKTIRFGPRIIDIDILLYEGFSSTDEILTVPHPRMKERAFVAVPLYEIAPDLEIEGVKLATILEFLDGEQIRKLKNDMDRANKIMNHPVYKEHLKKIAEHEVKRIYCRHDLVHFLDVSRIAWILAMEEETKTDKEVVYACGLLHDIGRWIQYETKADHATESARLCVEILEESGFDAKEISMIREAIFHHRVKDEESTGLVSILFRADKYSRRCYDCPEIDGCKRFKNGEMPYLWY